MSAISKDDYTVLAAIIFNFISAAIYYNPIGRASKLTFTPEVTSKFNNICDSFIGKTWNDIVDSLSDALYELIKAGYLVDAN